MRSLADIIEKVHSGVFHVVFLDTQRKRIGSGTAFTSSKFLLTNGHVFDFPPETNEVWIRQSLHTSLSEGACLRVEDFRRRLVTASPPEEYDYAVLDVPELNQFKPFQFAIDGKNGHRIGDPVFFLGYPLEHKNLTCHSGVISSLYKTNNVEVIQIDASVNPSNSGGPLIDPKTERVLGIVTRKATGLTGMFNQLRLALKENMRVIDVATKGGASGVFIGGVSPMEAIKTGQFQIMQLLSEVERSANVGIGYAFSCKHVVEDVIYQTRVQN